MHIFFPFSAFSIQPFLSLTLSYTSLSFSFSPIFLSVSSSPPFSPRFPSTNSLPPPFFYFPPLSFYLPSSLVLCSSLVSVFCYSRFPLDLLPPHPFFFFYNSLSLSVIPSYSPSLTLSLPPSLILSVSPFIQLRPTLNCHVRPYCISSQASLCIFIISQSKYPSGTHV